MIYNKSGHPIEVKKISIRLWTLRDEIEAALGRRMKECEAAGVPLFIEDIKKYYNLAHGDHKNADGMASLMEELGDEVKADGDDESKVLNEAEEIVAEQALQGLETKKPNPILERPYTRQAPDLEKVSYGFILLSDINMENMLTFTKDKFLQGQSVVVEFLIPQNFMMMADVTYCHHYARTSRIISSSKPDYRVQCRFSFSIPGERDNLRNFLKSIEPTVPADKKKAKKDSEDDLGI
jgi:CheY-like chemotaxis protein